MSIILVAALTWAVMEYFVGPSREQKGYTRGKALACAVQFIEGRYGTSADTFSLNLECSSVRTVDSRYQVSGTTKGLYEVILTYRWAWRGAQGVGETSELPTRLSGTRSFICLVGHSVYSRESDEKWSVCFATEFRDDAVWGNGYVAPSWWEIFDHAAFEVDGLSHRSEADWRSIGLLAREQISGLMKTHFPCEIGYGYMTEMLERTLLNEPPSRPLAWIIEEAAYIAAREFLEHADREEFSKMPSWYALDTEYSPAFVTEVSTSYTDLDPTLGTFVVHLDCGPNADWYYDVELVRMLDDSVESWNLLSVEEHQQDLPQESECIYVSSAVVELLVPGLPRVAAGLLVPQWKAVREKLETELGYEPDAAQYAALAELDFFQRLSLRMIAHVGLQQGLLLAETIEDIVSQDHEDPSQSIPLDQK